MLESLRGKVRNIPIDPRLSKIAELGFIELDGCFLLKELANVTTNANTNDFPDKTGYECFINHIHIDDFTTENVSATSLVFASRLLSKWTQTNFGGQLVVIVGGDHEAAVVRCHRERQNESWLAQDLDGYEQAVLEISSSDSLFFDSLDFISNSP
jgi:hypothetical protein